MVLSDPNNAKPADFKMLEKPVKARISNEIHDAKTHYQLNLNNQLIRKSTGDGLDRVVASHYDVFLHITQAHEAVGHAGIRKTFEHANKSVYGISKEDVTWLLRHCKICLNNRANATKPPLEPIVVNNTLERVQIDLMDFRHEPSREYKWILHVKDHFSKLSILYALTTKRASEVAFWINIFIRHYGMFDICQCDNGKEFKGACLILLKRYGIRVVNGRPRSPQTQGLVEQANSVAKAKIRAWKLITGSSEWALALTDVSIQMSQQTHTSLPAKYTAHLVFFGREPRALTARQATRVSAEDVALLALTETAIDEACAAEGPFDPAINAALEFLPVESEGQAESNNPGRRFQDGEATDVVPDSSDRSGNEEDNDESPPKPFYPSLIDPALIQANHNVRESAVQQHQAKVRGRMALQYSKNHKVRVFKEGDVISLKVPREDRAATDSKRITGIVLRIPHDGKHRIQTKFGILKCLENTRDLNGVPEEDWADWKNTLGGAPTKIITLHGAAAKDSTSTRINVSCSCQKKCTARCRCVKNQLKCTQYCHGDRRDCGAMGTILEATEESIIERDSLVGQPDLPNRSTITLPKRTRKNTASAPKAPPTKRRKVRPQLQVEDEDDLHQTTLSQYTAMEPTVRHLETLQAGRRKKKIPGNILAFI